MHGGRVSWTLLGHRTTDHNGTRWSAHTFVACDEETGVWHLIAHEDTGKWIFNKVYKAQGPMLAYDVSLDCEEPCEDYAIRVKDLSTGQLVTDAMPTAEFDYYYRIRKTVLTRSGRLVFAGTLKHAFRTRVNRKRIVQVGPHYHYHVIDGGKTLRLRSLRLRGGTIRWTHGHTHRSIQAP
jgi:hypothetical protein